MHKYFNPKKFVNIINKIQPFIILGVLIFLTLGIYYALISSPADYQQGESVRIMYVHVPAAWLSMLIYSFVAMMGIASLVWKNPLSDIIAISAAPIGAMFTVICLITGMLWGKPIWGSWWVWDARLTSVLILLFFYVGYIALIDAYDNEQRGAKSAAILSIVGLINIPIIKFSVDWWNTLHQPASIIRSGGVAIDPSMLKPLLLMFGFYSCFFIMILFMSIKTKINNKKLSRM